MEGSITVRYDTDEHSTVLAGTDDGGYWVSDGLIPIQFPITHTWLHGAGFIYVADNGDGEDVLGDILDELPDEEHVITDEDGGPDTPSEDEDWMEVEHDGDGEPVLDF